MLPLVAVLAVAGCGGEEPDRKIELFESGTLERLELDGRVLVGDEVDDDDDAADVYVVMCMSNPLTVIPSTDAGDRAALRDLQIYIDRETLRLTSVALRVEDDWVHWEAGDGGEAPVFRVDGTEFSLDGTLTDAAGTHVVGVAGTCETLFD